MRTFTASELDDVLAPVALERARILAPWFFGGIAMALLLSEPTGVALSAPVIAWNLFALPAMAVLSMLLMRRRVSARWGHAALAVVWWIPLAGTLVSQYFNANPGLTFLVVAEVAAAAVMLDRRWVARSFLVLDAVWIPMMVSQRDDHTSLLIVLVVAAQIFALLFQQLVRSSLLNAETHRLLQAGTAHELANQLTELRASEEDRARLSEQLQHSQRMEVAGTLAAGLAHDMNNILCSIRSFAELLIAEPDVLSLRGDLAQIIVQSERGAELTRGLLTFSRRGQYRKEIVGVDSMIRDLVPLLSRTLPKTIKIRNQLGAGLARIEGDPNQLGQVLINLAVNAAHAMDGKGALTICSDQIVIDASAAAAFDLASGSYVRIQVIDTGIGMDEATRLRVFEPFFTTKALGQGTGLGLSTAWGVIHGHRGAIAVESQPGRGTTFTVHLPLTTAALPVVVAPPPSESRTSSATVLVVDDEPMVRRGTKRILERKGYTVLEATNGAEALEVFAREGAAIGLVILDMGMPVMGGPECFSLLRAISDVPVLVATGYTSDGEAQSLIARGAALIEKPYASADLTRDVARLLAQN